MKTLIIVESPGKIKTIQKILGADYVVVASYGHVKDLPKSKMGIDLTTFEADYVEMDNKKKQIAEIKSQAKRCDKVLICTDGDREGEGISQNIAELLALPKGAAIRCTFNEITSKAVKAAIATPRKIDENLVSSQQARRSLDRIVGYKLSPMLWKKVKRGLSAGRVQSVAVRLIAEREKEINAFISEEYWTVAGSFKGKKTEAFKASLKSVDSKRVVSSADDLEKSKAKPEDWRHLADETHAISCQGDSRSSSYVVSSFETKEVKDRPYPPFATSHLQMASANRLGFDTKKTMSVAQSLYEGVQMGAQTVGLITYMRTDSFNISKDAQTATKDFVLKTYGDKFYPDTPNFYKSKSGAQEAHECIRPTNIEFTPDSIKTYLTPEQFRLYSLIWQRFVASQMAPAEYNASTCDLKATHGVERTFRASGRVCTFDGWTRIYERDEDESGKLPVLTVGEAVDIVSIDAAKHMTEPPPRYTDASLVKVLEKEGIGRPSTYSSIITVVQDRGYVTKTGTGGRAPFKATELGILVTDSLMGHFPLIMEIGFTKEMEEHLDDIETGTRTYTAVLKEFYKEFEAELKAADKAMKVHKGGEKTDFDCPKCTQKMLKLLGRFGSFFCCSDEKCKYKMDVGDDGKPKEKCSDVMVGLSCDLCKGKIIKAQGRFGVYLCCEHYPAKKCTFTMKINKAGLPQRKVVPIDTGLACEKCGKGKLVIRVAGRSKKKEPRPFLSCSCFPKCRNALELPENLKLDGEKAIAAWRIQKQKDSKDIDAIKNV